MNNDKFVEIVEKLEASDFVKAFLIRHLEMHYDLINTYKAQADFYKAAQVVWDKWCTVLSKDVLLVKELIVELRDKLTPEELEKFEGSVNSVGRWTTERKN